jgi:hypothetical protein
MNAHFINFDTNNSFTKSILFRTVISCLFIICILFITLSFFIQYHQAFVDCISNDCSVSGSDGQSLEKGDHTVTESSVNDQESSNTVGPSLPSQFYRPPPIYNTSISKKVSDQTLVDNTQDAIFHDDATDIASLIKSTVDKQHHDNAVLESCLTDNWMDTGTKVNYSSPEKIHTSQLTGVPQKQLFSYRINDLKHAYSFLNLKLPSKRDISSINKNLISNQSQHTLLPSQDNNETESLRHNNILPNSETNDKDNNDVLPGTMDDDTISKYRPVKRKSLEFTKRSDHQVKRSKSTSCVGDSATRMKKRQDRWKSINDEKLFLSTVNESLLPAVLKKGESPIMESKRKQSCSQKPEVSPTPPKTRTTIEPRDVEPSPIDEFGKRKLTEEEEVNYDGDEESNLPYICEFDEPIDQSKFEHFDQGLTDQQLTKTKSHQSIKHDIPDLSFYEEEHTAYDCILNGLEMIPQGSKFSWVKKSKTHDRGYNNISLQQWDDNAELYHQKRMVSGSTSILGLTKIDQFKKDPDMEDTQYEDIDNLSEFEVGQICDEVKSSFRYANRSYSAPSLHTFRKLSESSKAPSEEPSEMNMKNHLPVDLNLNVYDDEMVPEPVKTAPPSPIKKFLKDSPKRISSVLKRKSFLVSGEDKQFNGHKHSTSVISNAFSLGSATTSRSNSPKKSLKSFVTSRSSHKKSMSINSISLTKPSIMSESNYFREFSTGYYDIDRTPTSDQSRVSSVPSGVIGEYDREKWRTLQALQNNVPVIVTSTND